MESSLLGGDENHRSRKKNEKRAKNRLINGRLSGNVVACNFTCEINYYSSNCVQEE